MSLVKPHVGNGYCLKLCQTASCQPEPMEAMCLLTCPSPQMHVHAGSLSYSPCHESLDDATAAGLVVVMKCMYSGEAEVLESLRFWWMIRHRRRRARSVQ